MKILSNKKLATVVTLLAVAVTSQTVAQDHSRDRGAPIVFTSPKTDTISTNLHEVNVKQAPFNKLESEIRKPFELFDSTPSQPRFVPPRQINNSPAVNKSNLKALLEKNAEEEFLNGKQNGLEDPNDPFKSPDSTMDPLRHKPKTALERYYDRLEREQGISTNSNSKTDLFGRKKERSTEEKNALESSKKENNSGREQDFYSRANGQMSNNAATDNGFYRTGKKPDGERTLRVNTSDPIDRASLQRETRMDNFKKLLDGPVRVQPQDSVGAQKSYSYGGAENTAQRPNYLTPTPTWSSAKPPTAALLNPGSSFSKSSGIVGGAARPIGLPDYATSAGASLSTPVTPVQQTKMKTSTFNPPTRR